MNALSGSPRRTVTIKATNEADGMTAREVVQALSTGDLDSKTNLIVRTTMTGKIKSLSWKE